LRNSDRGFLATLQLQAHHQVIALVAGPICEELFIGTRSLRSEHNDAEAANIGRLICRSASSLDAYLAFAEAEAVRLLREHSAAVHRVAEALLRRRTIFGREIDALIRGAARNGRLGTFGSPAVCRLPGGEDRMRAAHGQNDANDPMRTSQLSSKLLLDGPASAPIRASFEPLRSLPPKPKGRS
jgi:hypothetical protein